MLPVSWASHSEALRNCKIASRTWTLSIARWGRLWEVLPEVTPLETSKLWIYWGRKAGHNCLATVSHHHSFRVPLKRLTLLIENLVSCSWDLAKTYRFSEIAWRQQDSIFLATTVARSRQFRSGMQRKQSKWRMHCFHLACRWSALASRWFRRKRRGSGCSWVQCSTSHI